VGGFPQTATAAPLYRWLGALLLLVAAAVAAARGERRLAGCRRGPRRRRAEPATPIDGRPAAAQRAATVRVPLPGRLAALARTRGRLWRAVLLATALAGPRCWRPASGCPRRPSSRSTF